VLGVLACGDVQPGCPEGAAEIGDFGVTQVPFDEYCAQRECPRYDDAAARQPPDGPAGCAVTRISGCGFETITRNYGLYGSEWTYAADSHRLVFAGSYDDVEKSVGGCKDFGFSAGVARPLCPKEKSEPWCTPGPPAKGEADASSDASVHDEDAGS
jgi:hypothetical protein